MSEITKLYENAGVEKEVIKGCYDYYSKLGIDIWKENDCGGKNCDTCKKDKSIKRYPPFTAEKQLELFKLLIRHYKTEIYCRYTNNKYKLIIYTEDCCTSDMDSFENALASVICDIWGLLTDEEKQQVKGILE